MEETPWRFKSSRPHHFLFFENMKKNFLLGLIFFIFCHYNNVNGFDRTPLYCLSFNKKEQIIFVFNNSKVYNIEELSINNETIIHDEFYLYKDQEKLGSSFLRRDGYYYWGKNKWNNFYKYSLSEDNLALKIRYVLKKHKISTFFANLLNKSEYYVADKSFQCKILNSWEEVEEHLN